MLQAAAFVSVINAAVRSWNTQDYLKPAQVFAINAAFYLIGGKLCSTCLMYKTKKLSLLIVEPFGEPLNPVCGITKKDIFLLIFIIKHSIYLYLSEILLFEPKFIIVTHLITDYKTASCNTACNSLKWSLYCSEEKNVK